MKKYVRGKKKEKIYLLLHKLHDPEYFLYTGIALQSFQDTIFLHFNKVPIACLVKYLSYTCFFSYKFSEFVIESDDFIDSDTPFVP